MIQPSSSNEGIISVGTDSCSSGPGGPAEA